MKKIILFICCLAIISGKGFTQVAINAENTPADNSAILDIKSDSRGMLMPRLTSVQITEIQNPEDGLQVYNSETGSIYMYVSSSDAWKEIKYASGTIAPVHVCGSPFTDLRNGKTYNTVQIGTKCWMKENLNIGILVNAANDQTNNAIIEKYCQNNNEGNCNIYGGLYQWNEMMNYTSSSNSNPSGRQGICPAGWHIPSDAEWCQMDTYLDATVICSLTGMLGTDIGGKLKETGTAHWSLPNVGATNSSGFTALPGGNRANGGFFLDLTYGGAFWQSTEDPMHAGNSWHRSLTCINAQELRGWSNKLIGYSCRCVKD
jgi:uncharacterized protein (TIGR02145 family)